MVRVGIGAVLPTAQALLITRPALAWIWWYELGYLALGRQERAPGSASGHTGLPRGASPPPFLIKLPISGPLMIFPPAAGYRRVVRVGVDRARPVRPGLAHGLDPLGHEAVAVPQHDPLAGCAFMPPPFTPA